MSNYQIPMAEAQKIVNKMMTRANISVYEMISCAMMNGADVDKAVRRAIGEVIVYLMDKKYWEKHHDISSWVPFKDEFFEKVGECMKTVYGLSEDRISCSLGSAGDEKSSGQRRSSVYGDEYFRTAGKSGFFSC
mgnify:CR=1 FL=1